MANDRESHGDDDSEHPATKYGIYAEAGAPISVILCIIGARPHREVME